MPDGPEQVQTLTAAVRRARWWHAATGAVAGFALLVQLVLVVSGESVLDTASPPGLVQRLVRFVSYFTIQSNLLVLVVCVSLVRSVTYDAPTWRALRLASLVGITVTGIVHWFFLRPILHLHGWAAATDLMLHVVVPLLTVVGWVAYGPRPRITRDTIRPALVWPMGWVVYILVLGAVTGWYPYPFVDVDDLGYVRVLLNCVGVAVLFLGLCGAAGAADRILPTGRFRRG